MGGTCQSSPIEVAWVSVYANEVLKAACVEVQKRWEIEFLEIGLDRDQAHFFS